MWGNDSSLVKGSNRLPHYLESRSEMPLNDQFKRYMTDSAFADIRNGSIGGRAGSSNGAAAFLEFFVPSRRERESSKIHADS